jgi:hypothetical protein
MNEYDATDVLDGVLPATAFRPVGTPIRGTTPVMPSKVEITMSKQVMREEFELLPFDVSMGFMRNRANVEYTDIDFAYLNANCKGLYMLFNEHGYLGTQALGFELEDDLAMFILKFQGTEG